jgi:hypothetical protein
VATPSIQNEQLTEWLADPSVHRWRKRWSANNKPVMVRILSSFLGVSDVDSPEEQKKQGPTPTAEDQIRYYPYSTVPHLTVTEILTLNQRHLLGPPQCRSSLSFLPEKQCGKCDVYS